MREFPGRKRARAAAVALSLALLLSACSGTALYSDLDERQANELTAVLQEAGISASKAKAKAKDAGWEVLVPAGDFSKSVQVAEARGLPSQRRQSLCEIFKKEGFASSATEERGRYLCGLQEEFEKTLSAIPGVVDARVHIALPERDPLGNDGKPASVSVAIYQRQGVNLQESQTSLKLMLKDGIEGLDDVNKVTVQFFNVPNPAPVRSNAGGLPFSLNAMDPVLIAVVVGVIGLLAVLAFLFFGRGRRAAAPAARTLQEQTGANARAGVWNG